VKSSIAILVGGVAALALRNASAAVRHAVWAAVLAGALLIAPLTLLVPAVRIEAPAPLARTLNYFAEPGIPVPNPVSENELLVRLSEAGRVSPAPEPWRPWRAVLIAWSAGFAAVAGVFLMAGFRLSRTAGQSRAAGEASIAALARDIADRIGLPPSRLRVHWTESGIPPMAWGVLRPVILLPQVCSAWEEERLRQLLIHEAGHIRRHDVLTQMLANIACAAFWFNPLVWMAARRMLVERERACDDLVLQNGAKASSYAQGLLEMARVMGAGFATARVSPAMARRSQISGRLLAVLDPARPRRPLGRGIAAGIALAAVALCLPVAALRPLGASSAGPLLQFENVGAAVSAVTADMKAIGEVDNEIKAALRRQDAMAISLFYTPDALIISEGFPIRGRAAIEELNKFYFSQGVAGIEIHPEEFFTVGDYICELGYTEALKSAGQVLASSRYMTLWQNVQGNWRIHREFRTH
jgi:beta-lactamase regulating signal transducer with metallopeptidase domain/ketosteroid isomerase-like protein